MHTRRIGARRVLATGVACALALAAAPTAPVSADAWLPVDDAVGYDYSPGEPAIWGSVAGTVGAYYDKACTGGFAVAGDSGFFLLTAATCGWGIASDRSVRGDAGYYADTFATRPADPTVLLRMRAGNDAHQYVVDPLTGAMPGDGHVVGWKPTVDQVPGMLVGKMGVDTGWTEGRVLGTAPGRFGDWMLCTDAAAGPGDVGGPVWRNDETGLRALGTVVAVADSGGACYRPIQETLYQFGASLPAFGVPQGRPGPGRFAAGMPSYPGTANAGAAGRIIGKGLEWRLP